MEQDQCECMSWLKQIIKKSYETVATSSFDILNCALFFLSKYIFALKKFYFIYATNKV